MQDRVLVIGIDAMDPRIVDGLDLPNLKSLETYRRLETTIPPETPVAWSAASTGSNPGRYGIFDFINRDPKTYLPRLNLAEEKHGLVGMKFSCAMKGVPFWRILNEKDIKTTVIRWPVTFPAEKVKGRMLSGLGVVDIKGMLNSYSYYTDEDLGEDVEGKEKIIRVTIKNNLIETYISGPLIRKGSEIRDVRVPMKIMLKEGGAVINVQNQEFFLKPKQWSQMIRVKFKLRPFSHVYGIMKFYLISIRPTFKMYMTSVQIDPENQVVDITYPREYGKELVREIGLFYTLGMPEDTKAVTENKLSERVFLEQVKQIEEERRKMFFYEFERFEDGLYAFVFDAGDRLEHIFWRKMDLDSRNFEVPKEIEEYYVEKDRFIGEVLSRLDDDVKLIIFSDHGFSNFERQVNVNSWLVEEGYMSLKGDTSGTLFEFVDWENTQAYSLGFTSLYVNLKGREGKGIVDEAEKCDLIEEISKKLRKLKDGSRRVFTNVYKGEEIYEGRYSHLAPDLVLGFSPGYRMSWRSAVGALDPQVIFDNKGKWRGDHLVDRSHVPGVLFANFKTKEKNPNIIDIAPTVLKLFDVEIPRYMDGKALI